MRRVICSLVAAMLVAATAPGAGAESGSTGPTSLREPLVGAMSTGDHSPRDSSSGGPAVDADMDALIQAPPRPIIRKMRRVMPTSADLPGEAVRFPFRVFAPPTCPEAVRRGPPTRARVSRSFLVGDEGSLSTQVLAFRNARQASAALDNWFRGATQDCARYQPEDLFGSEIDQEIEITVVVTNRAIEAPISRLGDERRAVRTRVAIRLQSEGVLEVLGSVGAAYRHGRYLVFAETLGFGQGPNPGRVRPDFRLWRTAIETMLERVDALP